MVSSTMETALRIANFSHQYSGAVSMDYPDLELKLGENLLIKGSSGSGKSTLLHLIIGVLSAQNQGLQVLGETMHGLKESAGNALRKNKVAFVPQRPFFIKSLTLEENLAWAGIPLIGTQETTDALGITELLRKYPEALSLGQLQRMAIAKGVLSKKPILLLDEPTSSLDPENAAQVKAVLHPLLEAPETSVIVVSHDVSVAQWGFTKTMEL